MLKLSTSARFRRDLKLCQKRGYDLSLLEDMVNTLREPAPLPEKNHDHPLSGNWVGHQEAHILSDWLLVYRVDGEELYLARTGTHADLFGK